MLAVGVEFERAVIDYPLSLVRYMEEMYAVKVDREDIMPCIAKCDRQPGKLLLNMVEQAKIDIWHDLDPVRLMDDRLPFLSYELRKSDVKLVMMTATPKIGDYIGDWLRHKNIKHDGLMVFRSNDEMLRAPVTVYVDTNQEFAIKAANNGKKIVLLRQPENEGFAYSVNTSIGNARTYKERIKLNNIKRNVMYSQNWSGAKTCILEENGRVEEFKRNMLRAASDNAESKKRVRLL